MSDELFPYLLGFLGLALFIALAAVVWVMRAPKVHREEHERIPLFTGGLRPGEPMPPAPPPPTVGSSTGVPPRGTLVAPPTAPRPMTPAWGEPTVANGTGASHATPAAPSPRPVTVATPTPVAPRPITVAAATPAAPVRPITAERAGVAAREFTTSGAANGTPVAQNGVSGTMVEAHALRFSVPTDGTLQFLPGRFEIASGLDAGREIRFVRLPGPDGASVSFGRSEGPLYQHIQLRDQTVSRSHARMRYLHDGWHLTNLSTTNPVTVNGQLLAVNEEQLLHDGDRVEMGEVIFAYRTR